MSIKDYWWVILIIILMLLLFYMKCSQNSEIAENRQRLNGPPIKGRGPFRHHENR